MITFYHNFESVLISLRFQDLGHFLCKTMSSWGRGGTGVVGKIWIKKKCWVKKGRHSEIFLKSIL